MLKALFVSIVTLQIAGAATYYISPSGNDSNAGSSTAPWKSFSKAFGTMKGGDELILHDGVYSQAAGTGYIHYSGSGSAQPPSGTSAARTYVHAQNPGKVKINGGLFLGRSTQKNSYITIEGITFEGSSILYNTSYVIVRACGFHDMSASGGVTFGIGTNDGSWGNSNNLIEDVWVWGQNRGIASNYQSDNNVWRRIIVRGDGCNSSECTGSGNPNIGITVYDSANVSVQNVVVLDRILGGGSNYSDFATAQHTGGRAFGNNEWLGTMSLNSEDNCYMLEADNTSLNNPTWGLQNVVGWNCMNTGVNASGPSGARAEVTNGTFHIRSGSGVGIRIPGAGTVRRVIVTGNNAFATNIGGTLTYADVYGTWTNGVHYGSACSTGCKTSDPLADSNPPSLKYVGRIEAGSLLKGAGDGGSDIGANVVNRYGVDGSTYGQAGFNTLTNTPLWPWPNEARIKKEMCTDSGVTRGFCSAVSLTSYVWNLLGNGNPYGQSGVSSSSTSLVSSLNPSGTGAAVTFRASVYPTDATGTVQFFDGSTVIGSSAVSGGAASFATSSLAAGSHSVTAVYSGDAKYAGSTSSAVVQTVNSTKTNTTIVVTTSASSVAAGQSVTFTATVSPTAATGTVQFKDGATVLGSATLSGGKAAYTTTALTAGTHSITAVYAGNTSYNTSTSAALTQTITSASKTNTTTTVVTSASSVTAGQSVTFTATVSPTAATGTVQFKDGATVLGSATLSGGKAAYTTTALTAGTHSITAAYAGNTSYNASTSGAISQIITSSSTKTNTATAVTASASSVNLNQSVTFTATISPSAATGTVQFKNGGSVFGTATVSGGKAVFTVQATVAGTHSVVAVYGGSSSYNGSTSPGFTLTVSSSSKTSTSTILSASATSVSSGQAVTFTAVVSPSAATGTVQFKDGATVFATATLSGGRAAVTTTALAAGSHSITATYGGATNYNGSASGPVAVTVGGTKTNTTTVVAVSPASTTYGQSVTFTAMVSPSAATGTVQFLDGATVLASSALSGGRATFVSTTLASGTHSVSARYSGNTSYNASTSATVTQKVSPIPTSVTISMSPNPATAGQMVTLTARVTPSAATGTVDFLDSSKVIGSATLSGGAAVLRTSSLAVGSHYMTAHYKGSVSHWDSWTQVITQKVVSATASASACAQAGVHCVGAGAEFATIQAAANVAAPGDTITVAAGNYAGFRVTRSGTAASPITFKADGAVTISTPSSTGDGIYLSNVSYVHVAGFTIKNPPQHCIAARDASANRPVYGLNIRGITCSGAAHGGFYLSQVASSLVENNTISEPGDSHGIYLANAGSDNTTLRGNTIHHVSRSDSAAMHFNGDLSVGGDGVISGLLVENNTMYDLAMNGFSLDGVQDATFRNNLVYRVGRHAFRAFQIDGGQGPRALTLANNTFATTASGGWAVKISEDMGGHKVFNNILFTENSGTGSLCVESSALVASSNNVVVNRFSNNGEASIISLAQWKRAGDDTNSTVSTALATFAGAAAGNYRLANRSSARDAGVASFSGAVAPVADLTGTARPQGGAHDIGAYEA